MEDVFDAAWQPDLSDPAAGTEPWQTAADAPRPLPSITASAAAGAVDVTLASLVDVHGPALLRQPDRFRALLAAAHPDRAPQVAALVAALSAGIPARLALAGAGDRLTPLLQQSLRLLREHEGMDAFWAAWTLRTWTHALALPTTGIDAVPGRATESSVVPDAMRTAGSPIDAAADGDEPDVPPALVEPLFPEAPPRPWPDAPPGDAVRDDDGDELRAVLRGAEARAAPRARPPRIEPRDPPPALEADALQPASKVAFALIAAVVVALFVAWFVVDPTGRSVDWPRPAVPEGMAGVVAPGPGDPPSVRVAADPGMPRPATTTPSIAAPTPPPVEPAPTTADATAAVEGTAGVPTASSPAHEPAASTATTEPAPPDSGAAATPAASVGPASGTRRPVIARIDTPRIVEGDPFDVVLQVDGDARDVVAVQRDVGASSGTWPRSGNVTVASGLVRAGAHALLVPFRAMDGPARATVTFVAIGRDGRRSEPKAVELAVRDALPVGTVVAPSDRSSARLGASGAAPGDACAGATCGTVLDAAVMIPGGDTRDTVYRIVVRTDDRRTHVFTAPYRLQIGSRVRRVDGGFAPGAS